MFNILGHIWAKVLSPVNKHAHRSLLFTLQQHKHENYSSLYLKTRKALEIHLVQLKIEHELQQPLP